MMALIKKPFQIIFILLIILSGNFIPEHVQAEETIHELEVEIFTSPIPLPYGKVSEHFFGGIFSYIQLNSIQPAFWAIFSLLMVLIAIHHMLSRRFWVICCLGLISLLSIILSLKISQGWDEFFINLRHSYVLSLTGHFSYNLHNLAEGTVDFLPFGFAGILGILGFPLIETMICLTLCGNILIIVAAWLLAHKITQDDQSSMVMALGAGTLPCVLFVGGTGFTATIFTGCILFSIFYSFFEPSKKLIGLTLISLLTLVRTEGILLAFFFWSYFFLIEPIRKSSQNGMTAKDIKQSLIAGALMCSPFIFSLIIRKTCFGYPLPMPIIYKNTHLNFNYLFAGLNQLRSSLLTFEIISFIALIFGPIIYLLSRKKIDGKIFILLLILSSFCFVYFTSGGDWFPIHWNRYMMPFTIFFMLTVWIVMQKFLKDVLPKSKNTYLFIFFLLLIPFFHPDVNSYQFLHTEIQSDRNRWDRIDSLAYFGEFLRDTTQKNTIIASPEMATVNYYAERDILDLLGIANPEIAQSKLDPISESDLMHRRRNPATILNNKPGIIAFFGMSKFEEFKTNKTDIYDIKYEIIRRFGDFEFSQVYQNYNRADLAYYRAGSFDYLTKLGYKLITVTTPTSTFNYLVHNSIYKEHIMMLRAIGIKSLGSLTLQYSLPAHLTKKFSSGEELISP